MDTLIKTISALIAHVVDKRASQDEINRLVKYSADIMYARKKYEAKCQRSYIDNHINEISKAYEIKLTPDL